MLDLELIEFERPALDDVVTPDDVRRRLTQLQLDERAGADDFITCARGFQSFGMAQEAFRAYSIAIERKSDGGEAYLERAEVGFGLCLLDENDGERSKRAGQVIEDYRRSCELSTEHFERGALGLAMTLLLVNRVAECSDWLDQMAARGGRDRSEQTDLLFLVAFCRLFSGDVEEARKAAERIESLQGSNEDSVFINGACALFSGDREEAKDCRELLERKESRLATSLSSLEDQGCETFLNVARAMLSDPGMRE
jgi:hypothetical protein